MDRDELILNCYPMVDNLVKKYNNGRVDEDLRSVGIIECIKCIDTNLAKGISEEKELMPRCNIWARNGILQEIYKQKDLQPDDEEFFNNVEAPEEDPFLISDVKKQLTKKQNEVFDLLLAGKDRDEICQILGVEKRVIFRHLARIKEVIKNRMED